MALQDFTPKNRITDSVIEEEALAEPQSIMEVSTTIEESPPYSVNFFQVKLGRGLFLKLFGNSPLWIYKSSFMICSKSSTFAENKVANPGCVLISH